MEQLLLVTSCDSPAEIGASLRTHTGTDELTDGLTNGWTHRHDIGNSILDSTYIEIRSAVVHIKANFIGDSSRFNKAHFMKYDYFQEGATTEKSAATP